MDVGGGEVKQTVSGAEQPVLAAVVSDEAGAVDTAVVLDAEFLGGVVEIRAAQEAALVIV